MKTSPLEMSRPRPEPEAAVADPASPRPEAPARDGARPEAVLRPAWAEIDLDALTANLRRLRRDLPSPSGEPARILAVIKADAYGHGAPRVSRALEAAGVDWLGAALLEEGAEVRRAGVETPILVLGVAQPGQLPFYRRYRLTPTVSGMDQLALWRDWLAGEGGGSEGSREASSRYVQPIHLQVDTGMARLGIRPEELPGALDQIRRSPHLRLEGLLSHFADADLPESDRTALQEARFEDLLEALTGEERGRVLVHLANSAGSLHHPRSRHGMMRLGLALYGHDPAGLADGELEPVMGVKTRIVLIRAMAPGDRVGYGGLWTARRPSRVAILPVGYADGYAYRLSPGRSAGKPGEALLAGRRVPMAGAVSMDMSFFDVTEVPEARVGDEMVLLGRERRPSAGSDGPANGTADGTGEPRITVRELAESVGTLPYELLCLLGLRLARHYLEGGASAGISSRFEGRWE